MKKKFFSLIFVFCFFMPLFAVPSEKERAMENAIKIFFSKGIYIEVIESDNEYEFYNKENVIHVNTKNSNKLVITFATGIPNNSRSVTFKSISNDEDGNLILIED